MALSLWLSGIAVAVQPADGNWPGWRGDGSGISAETSLPRSWDSTNGILWRTPLPGEGSSSPVVWGTRVFVTASTAGGTNRLVLCLDSRDGHLLWQRQVVAARIPRTDPKGGYAPATPVTDGKRLFVFFDAPGLVAFDLDGTQLWTLPLGPFKTPYNVTASPILFRDRVIQCCDQSRDGFLLAADSDTGKVLWKTPRTLGCHYATPLLVAHQDVWQVVASGSSVKGYDLDTGSERWSCAGLTDTVAPSPVLGADGLVYATSGRNGPSLAIDPGGTGDVKETHMRLQVPAGGPYVPSPLFAGVLILPDDDGVVRIVTAQGVVRVAARLHDHFTASPVLAGTCIYWPAESGTVYVLDAGARSAEEPALPVIAANALGERCLASPAIAGNCLFIRTTRALVCISGTTTAPGSRLLLPSRPSPPADFETLKQRFADHAATDGDDIPIRLAVVEGLAEARTPEAVRFLQSAAVKDPHWDVCEAAAKAVAASDTPATVAALLALANDRRSYIKIIAADGLGRLRTGEAVSMLLGGITDPDPLVRIARLHAVAEIATVVPIDAGPVLAALQNALTDKEGPVRVAAIDAWATMAARRDLDRVAIARVLQTAAADANPLVAAAARKALRKLAP